MSESRNKFLNTSLGRDAIRRWGGSTVYQPVNYMDQASGGVSDSQVKRMLNMTPPSKSGMYRNFDRFYSIYPEYELSSLRHYIFIVRPDLNIVSGGGSSTQVSATCRNNQLIRDTCAKRPIIARHLTDTLDGNHDFMPFLVGRTESIQIPDFTLKSYTISQPYTNYLMPYAGTAIESQTGGSFEITFRDDCELNISRMFQVYVTYVDGVRRNIFKPKNKYIYYNKLDYAVSVYNIVCGPDGEKILWWSKYTGAFPLAAPNSNMSFNLRGTVEPKISIPFAYFIHEALDPEILVDFNQNSRGSVSKSESTYDSFVHGSGSGIVGSPFIVTDGQDYYLGWRPYSGV